MEPNHRKRQEPCAEDFITISKRWEQIAASMIQKRTPKLKWLRFAEKTLRKYAYINKFNRTEKRVQAQKLKERHLMENEQIHSSEPFSEIDMRENSIETKSRRSSYFYLDSRLKNFLTGILNIRIPPVKIYTNQVSDALVKQFNADALSYNDKIFFKTGRYDLQDKKGIALLGHELTHAAQLKMQNQNLPEPTVVDEQEAMNNEKRVLHYFSSSELYSQSKKPLSHNPGDNYLKEHRFDSEAYESYKNPASTHTLDNSAYINKLHHTQANAPRTALISRDLSLAPGTDKNLNSAFQLSEQQIRLIKDEVYRDIMNRIRIEFERGG